MIARKVASVCIVPKHTNRGLIADENIPTEIDCNIVWIPKMIKFTGDLYLNSGFETSATMTPVDTRYEVIINTLKLLNKNCCKLGLFIIIAVIAIVQTI